MKAIQTAKRGYIIAAAVFCITGILLISKPSISLKAVCMLVGILLVLYSIIKIIGYFSKDLYRLAFQFDLALGLLFLAIGLLLLFRSGQVISFLNFVIGVIIFSDGLFRLQLAVDARQFGISQWWIITVISIFVCIFGLFLMFNPFENALLTMILTGITLLLEGILNFCVAVFTVKLLKKEQSNVIKRNTKGDKSEREIVFTQQVCVCAAATNLKCADKQRRYEDRYD